MSSEALIRVLLVDDHGLVRAGLKRVLEEAPDISVVAEASSGWEAVQEFGSANPDVVLMDISMPGMDGLETSKRLLASSSRARILALTMYPEEHYAVRMLKVGCLGYITKGTSPQILHHAVRAVARGERFLSEEGKGAVAFQLLSSEAKAAPIANLSDRELQVVCLIARGLTLKEVSIQLNLSVKTVETYRRRVLNKLALRNNADICRFAFENGLLQE